jgi:ABC-type phosphate/phosphonate transport system substrate-binding protein
MSGAAVAMSLPKLVHAEMPASILNLAMSIDTLAGANVNDARAAYRLWINVIIRQFALTCVQPVPDIFIPSEEVIRGVRQGTIECFGITALEFSRISNLIDPASLILQDYVADGLEYVILVHRKSPFKKLADLLGAQVILHQHRDTLLVPAWLTTMLAASSLPRPERFFASQKFTDNLNQVLLPVFFRRADGAVLVRRNWDTAIELNPQLGNDLNTIAISPKIVPAAIGFRRGCIPEARGAVLNAFAKISTVPAGQQIVALYQSRGIAIRSASVMNGTLEMVREFDRLQNNSVSSIKSKS